MSLPFQKRFSLTLVAFFVLTFAGLSAHHHSEINKGSDLSSCSVCFHASSPKISQPDDSSFQINFEKPVLVKPSSGPNWNLEVLELAPPSRAPPAL